MLKTNVERIQKDIESLAQFSCVEGIGCTRFTYTKEFAQARDYIVSEMKAAGLQVREDAVGIIIGRMEGKNPDAPVVMTGSHFDTVKTGGRFDGPAGVIAGLETARVLHEEGFVPECPIEFVALPEEEGARFGSGLFGSRAMCGQLKPGEIENNKDWDGVTVAEAMKGYGLDPSKAAEAQRKPGEIGTFLELHIEQGPLLEKTKTDIGIVDAIVGLRVFDIHVYGRSDHAGN
ncbi:MAG: hydantoinase/carbamoylase family amidase, partial [Firmicutes bacterium]|nr:hydantoinase/carbamoylase family amidase [Bacillota bacterium]